MSDPFIGEIRLLGFPRIPQGWLACDGSSQSIANYQALYALIGTTYGGNGQTTFNLPDLRGRVPIGQGQGPGMPMYTIGQPGGEDMHTLNSNEIPSHSHGLTSSTTTANNATPGTGVHLGTASTGNLYASPANIPSWDVMAPCVSNAGQSQPHNNIMPTVVANYVICVEGIYPSAG